MIYMFIAPSLSAQHFPPFTCGKTNENTFIQDSVHPEETNMRAVVATVSIRETLP